MAELWSFPLPGIYYVFTTHKRLSSQATCNTLHTNLLHILRRTLVIQRILNSKVLLPRILDQRIKPGLTRPSFPRPRPIVAKRNLNLLQTLIGGLRVREVELGSRQHAQHAKNDEKPVLDIDEARRDVQAQSKVESPVTERRDGHSYGAGLERPHFCGVDPAHGGEG